MNQNKTPINYILHFDLNETFCGFDSTKATGDQDITTKKKMKALTTIAKYLRGNEFTHEFGSTFMPCENGPMTYKEFLASRYDKKTRETITQNIMVDFCDNKEIGKMYDIIMKGLGDNVLYRSAILFLKYARADKNNKYVILFRTFGTDFETVHEELKTIFKDIKIAYARPSACHEYFDLIDRALVSDDNILFFYIKDNYMEWSKNHHSAMYGKLFPLVLKPNCINAFFDDNENIVNPRCQDNEYQDVLPKNCYNILVNSYENVVNDSYFIDILKSFDQDVTENTLSHELLACQIHDNTAKKRKSE
jgi:hypothetical protein